MIYFKIAIRNIFRNRIRTLITLLAISFGCISLILVGGFVNNSLTNLRESTIYSQLGHIQICQRGFFEKGALSPFDYMIQDGMKLNNVLKSLKHVEHVMPRLGFAGLISTGENTFPFVGEGVDPNVESKIGQYMGMHDGENLDPEDPYGAILGKGMAASIETRVGDYLVILTNTKDGAINALDVRVRGVFCTSSKDYDDRVLRLPVKTAQQLLYTDEVQKIVLILDKTENTEGVKQELLTLFRKKKLNLELKTWQQLADFYNKAVALYKRQLAVINIIIAVIVILGISNTMSMAIFERTREIGTIMALGAKRREVLLLFLMEGGALGMLGGTMGIVGGVCIAHVISIIGIPMPPPPGSTVSYSASIDVVPEILVSTFLLSFLSALISSFYPALKASRLDAAAALRYI